MSVKLLTVKLWALVLKKFMLELFISYFIDKSQNSVDNTALLNVSVCAQSARDVELLSVCVCVTTKEKSRNMEIQGFCLTTAI